MRDLPIKSMIKKDKILYSLILLFFATLFFSKTTSINIGVMAALVLYCFFYSSWSEKWQLLKQRKAIIFMLVFFLYLLVSGLFSENTENTLHTLKIRLPLFFFPVSIGLIQLRKSFKEQILLHFAFITTFIGIVCLGFSVYQYSLYHRSDIFYNDNLTLVLKQQSIYVALLVNFAIFIFGRFLLFTNYRNKFWMGLATVFLFGISYLLASRINLAILAFVSLAACSYYIISRKKIMEGFVLVLGLLMLAFAIYKFKPTSFNRFKELAFTQFNFENQGNDSHFNVKVEADQWNGANFRLAAWKCGWEVFKEHPILGTGIGNKDDALREKYTQKNFHFALKHNRNVHSNYLDILFSLGIIGFTLFLFGWLILPFLKAITDHDALAVIIILTIAVAWITEVYFSRNFGTLIVSFFIPFLLTDKK